MQGISTNKPKDHRRFAAEGSTLPAIDGFPAKSVQAGVGDYMKSRPTCSLVGADVRGTGGGGYWVILNQWYNLFRVSQDNCGPLVPEVCFRQL